MKNKIYIVGIVAFLLVWFGLTGAAWFGEAEAVSMTERRALAQAPALNMETILAKDVLDSSGNIKEARSYKSLFEDYVLDQFPLRDRFRQVKAIFSNYVMQQMDDNNYYIADGYAAELVYPMDEQRLNLNLKILKEITEKNLGKNKVYSAVVPDKGYFLAEKNGYLSLDYSEMFQAIQEGLPEKVQHIDLTDVLSIDDYYRTDTHWRQEHIVPAAQKIAEAMGTEVLAESEYTKEAVENPFYGVYYGFAALPMDPETMYLMQSSVLEGCTVSFGEMQDGGIVWNPAQFYDMSKAESNDLYDIFFSGNQALIQIVNPQSSSPKELVVFGDSFGRSLIPLLAQGYRKITVIDLRLTKYNTLDQVMQFTPRQDVLFLFSTLSYNKSIAS
ncbi:MAG: hypothetical protein IJY91_00635 [Oscillospiraceae bacterium]|nr:hypothetical protein [Oscillospiraceae bacterium]